MTNPAIKEFVVSGRSYQSRRLSGLQQLHVARRLGAVGPAVITSVLMLRQSLSESNDEDIVRIAEPAMKALASMSDEDANYVVNECMSTLTRQEPGGLGWQRVMASPGVFQYADIELPQIVQLVWRVLEFNLSGFFSELLLVFADQQETADSTASSGSTSRTE